MNNLYFKKKLLSVITITILSSSQAFSETVQEPLELQKIMNDMSKNMQLITGSISREDWALIEKTAPLIANHPQPPLTEKTRILAFVGSNIRTFKKFDGKTHMAARLLGEAAAAKDGLAVISNFATLQNSCLKCHQTFRKSFQNHFYGKQ